ncbi:uncharacterized protein GGS22DRAFT_186099 [Annulohypoxylon maeteangense]|uniref:uncharacterized protein n=1 Tax=Annulohypoxylon maeteangense TaxID=1927788 RepID=UPI002007B439|nr:uncharacterized protein GGS22DRAFT_186099 [Annulohypoxylon maeteangense]KAI0887266.1 hypothetical protein GGS22DRAFT_186099 [Annulohypoxylon maeteangense]
MRAIHFCYIFAISCFQVATLAAANGPDADPEYNPAWGPAFDTNTCPEYYLRETGNNSTLTIELVATCSDGSDTSQYRTSSLNLDQCLYNEEGDLFSSEPHDYYTGPFSKTCHNCGLAFLSIDGDTEGVYLRCTCWVAIDDDHTPKQSMFRLGRSIYVKNSTLGCFEFTGQTIDNPLPYQNVTPPVSSVTTVTATVLANVTISPTISPPRFTNSTSIQPSTVTVTKTHVMTQEPVTQTATETVVSPVTILVSIKVTETPTPTPRISAILYTTVQASFVTFNPSSDGVGFRRHIQGL